MEYSKESKDRMKKIQDLKDAGVICYANKFEDKMDISEIRNADKSTYKPAEDLMEGGAVGEYRTAGRLMQSRGMGKLVFAKLRDHSGDLQISFMKANVVFNTGRELVEDIEVG